MSPKSRRVALLCLDPHQSDMEHGHATNCMVFGEPFIAELCKHVILYTTLSKVLTSLCKFFQPDGGVFGRAGYQQCYVSSQQSLGPRPQYGHVSTSFAKNTFFPTSQGSFRGHPDTGHNEKDTLVAYHCNPFSVLCPLEQKDSPIFPALCTTSPQTPESPNNRGFLSRVYIPPHQIQPPKPLWLNQDIQALLSSEKHAVHNN